MRTIIASPLKKLPALPFTPTSYVTNGKVTPPASQLSVTVIPVDPMVKGEPGILQNDWRLVMAADALVLVGRNDHLYTCARKWDLAIYAPDYDPRDDADLFAAAGWDERNLFGGSAEPDLFGGAPAVEPDLFGTGQGEPNLFAG